MQSVLKRLRLKCDYNPYKFLENIFNYADNGIHKRGLTKDQITSVFGDLFEFNVREYPDLRSVAERLVRRVREKEELVLHGGFGEELLRIDEDSSDADST